MPSNRDDRPNFRDVRVFEDQSVSFVELFFDLVFVFSVSKVVGVLHHGHDWGAIGQTVLVFWLVWWAWSQFTWALNAADTDHVWIKVAVLTATAVAFFMAIAVPSAFGGKAVWFAITYALLRGIGFALQHWASSTNVAHARATRMFALLSLSGLAAVLAGGLLGGTAQYVLWAAAIVLDISAAVVTARPQEEVHLYHEHFAERHGLFVIIALGETVIVAGSGVAGETWTGSLLAVAILAVGVTCGLWWTYFHLAKPALDRALEVHDGPELGAIATVVFSVLHYPLMLGVISFSFGIELAVEHASEPLALVTRVALALGLVLFVGGMVICLWRARQGVLWFRGGLIATVAVGIVASEGATAPMVLGVTLAALVVLALVEERRVAELLTSSSPAAKRVDSPAPVPPVE